MGEILKWQNLGSRGPQRNINLKKCNSSVPNSKENFAGSFPKCAGENPTKSRKMAGMPTNVKIDKIPEIYQNL